MWPSLSWHILLTPPLEGAANMAIDEGLMARARATGEGVVRVYSWIRPTLSLGRNQHAIGSYSAERAQARGIPVVRRPTGGRALLHHREITYSVTAPALARESLTTTYRAINELLVAALGGIGVSAEIARRGERLPPPGSAPCFELPAPGELMVQGRKLVGSAQIRERGAMLQHGSILVDDDQPLIAELAEAPVGEPVPAATLRQVLGRAPSPSEFADALLGAIRSRWDRSAVLVTGRMVDDAAFEEAHVRYLSDDWTWRR